MEKVILKYAREHFPGNVDVDVTGLTMAVSHSSRTVTMGQVKSLSLALACIFLLLSVLFLSPRVGLYAMMPNFFPILVNFGIMGWLDIHLSVATSLIASIAIGLSVDDTIHYVFRFNQELKKDLSRRQAMARTTMAVGKPIVFTSLTIGLGFSVLLFSSFVPTMIFGLLMLITVASALVGDLFILAAILLRIQLVTLWDLLRLKLGSDPREGIPLFDGLSRSQVYYLLMAGALRKYERGQVLFRKGEISESMYAVISGFLDVVEEFDSEEKDIHRTPKLIATLGKGELVGEMGMVRQCERSATVVARTEAELLEINDKMIQRLQWLFSPTAQKFFFNLMTIISDRLEERTQALARMQTLDEVTGLHDRIYFEKALDDEILRARRYDTPLAVLLAEIDASDEIIAAGGHEAGHLVLSETGPMFKKQMRASDTVCRFGPELFAAALPNTRADGARRTGERVRELFHQHRFDFGAPDLHITVSVGFAALDLDSNEATAELVEKASRALERAKGKGGNRVEGE